MCKVASVEAMTRGQIISKRLFDVPVAFIGLMALFVPMGLMGLIVRLTSAGPALYRHTRIGRHARPFRCVKFRTMYLDSDSQGSITTASDSRVTPVGRVLRKYKLDELPQLWNILRGNMSFVGPRPDVAGYADRLEGEQRRILDLYPGITGPATLRFRDEEMLLSRVADPKRYNDEVIFPEKVRLNLAYLENWSIWKDLGYILFTVAPSICLRLGISRRLDGCPPGPGIQA